MDCLDLSSSLSLFSHFLISGFLFIFSHVFYVQHEAHLFKEKPGPFLLVAFEVSSLCALSWCASQPHGFCLAFTQLLNHHFDSLLSVFFPPSSASSQSPAADPRKSCCFSVLAYVIPTYLYVILCNVFCCSSNTPNNIPASTALCRDESCWTEQSRLMSANVFVITMRTFVKNYSCSGRLASSLSPRYLDLAC